MTEMALLGTSFVFTHVLTHFIAILFIECMLTRTSTLQVQSDHMVVQ
jgi:hypothetical protein